VYKKFGPNLAITDHENRKQDKKPKIVAEFMKPNYRVNVWDFKTGDVNSLVPALYSRHVSLATLDGLKCLVCQSGYRVEMHHIRMMSDLNPEKNRLDYLMAKAKRKQIPLCRSCHMKYHNGKLDLGDLTVENSNP